MKVLTMSLHVDLITKQKLVNTLSREAAMSHSRSVCVANVHMVIEAYKHPELAHIIDSADYVITDGMPLIWYLKNIYNIQQERIAGMDLLPELLSRAETQGQSVYFYGGTEEMLDRTRAYIKEMFPGLTVAGTYSPPFRNLTAEEKEAVIDTINQAAPTWVFVVLGCPKQEEWMASMKGAIRAVMVGVGGALPVMVGMLRRAPVWMQKIGCEWLFRLWQEPRRLWKRYGVTNSLFLYLFVKEFVQRKIFKKPFAQLQ